jgi:hypothetical protein
LTRSFFCLHFSARAALAFAARSNAILTRKHPHDFVAPDLIRLAVTFFVLPHLHWQSHVSLRQSFLSKSPSTCQSTFNQEFFGGFGCGFVCIT